MKTFGFYDFECFFSGISHSNLVDRDGLLFKLCEITLLAGNFQPKQLRSIVKRMSINKGSVYRLKQFEGSNDLVNGAIDRLVGEFSFFNEVLRV